MSTSYSSDSALYLHLNNEIGNKRRMRSKLLDKTHDFNFSTGEGISLPIRFSHACVVLYRCPIILWFLINTEYLSQMTADPFPFHKINPSVLLYCPEDLNSPLVFGCGSCCSFEIFCVQYLWIMLGAGEGSHCSARHLVVDIVLSIQGRHVI